MANTYQPLTKEQYDKAISSGFTHEQIVQNELKRKQDTLAGTLPVTTPPTLKQTLSGRIEGIKEGLSGNKGGIVGGTQAVAEATSIPVDIATAAISKVTPEPVKKVASKVGETVSGGVNKLVDMFGSSEKLQDFVMKHPEAAKYLQDTLQTTSNIGQIAGNISATQPVKLTKAVGKPVVDVTKAVTPEIIKEPVGRFAEKAGTLAQATAESVPSLPRIAKAKIGTKGTVEQGLSDIAKQNVQKTVEKNLDTVLPVGKKEVTKLAQKYEKAADAFTDIVATARKEGADTPKNILETLEASNNRMSNLYQEYSTKLTGADKNKFNTSILDSVDSEIKRLENGMSTTISSDTRKIMSQQLGELNKLKTNAQTGTLTPADVQEYVQTLNQKSKSLFAGGRATIDAVESANLSKKLVDAIDSSIEKIDGPQYKELRKLYGAHKSLQSQLEMAAKKEINKIPGLQEKLANAGATLEAAQFVLTSNPKTLLVAGGIKGISALSKYLSSPTRALRKIIKTIEKEQIKTERAQKVVSKFKGTGKKTEPTTKQPNILALPAPTTRYVSGKPIVLPKSIREYNMGTNELKKAKIVKPTTKQ